LPKTKRGDRKGARLQNDKGLEAFKKEQHEQGLQFFLAAYQLDAGDVEVVNNVGMAYLKTGNLPEAARYLGGALSLAPNRAAAWGNLAEVFARDSRQEEAVAAYALTYRYSKNKDATRRLLEAQTTNDDDPQVMQASKVALALPLISGRTESGEPAPTPPVAKPAPTPTPPQEAERPQQETASQQAPQAAASRCTGDQIEKMINAGFSKQEIMRLCETTTESPAKGTLSGEEVVAPVPTAQSQIMTMDELNAFAAQQAKAYKVTISSWGWPAVLWLASLLTAGDHRQVAGEASLTGMPPP
jgi:tetratricopeptide (TPR) repeat protein